MAKELEIKVVGVRFKEVGKIYYFDPDDLDLAAGDQVIVETVRGQEFGDVVVGPRWVDEEDVSKPLRKIIRKATGEDRDRLDKNRLDEVEALEVCARKIEEHRLPMKLVNAEYTFDRSKIIFYFTADGRVDFRNLVKDLAGVFRTRIELRQIGVRDEAKMIGGLGSCGRELCCSTFLGDFETVSIKMAKEQNLSLNPSKISGICGRLMCCLKYENKFYEQQKKKMPRQHTRVRTPFGVGAIDSVNLLQELVSVKYADGKREIFELTDIERVEKDTPLDARERSSVGEAARLRSAREHNRDRGGAPSGRDKQDGKSDRSKSKSKRRKKKPSRAKERDDKKQDSPQGAKDNKKKSNNKRRRPRKKDDSKNTNPAKKNEGAKNTSGGDKRDAQKKKRRPRRKPKPKTSQDGGGKQPNDDASRGTNGNH